MGAALAKRAKFKRSHPWSLLRVGPHGAATDYGSARHGWRIGRRWVDAARRGRPRWAVVVAGDLVDAVYRIERLGAVAVASGRRRRALRPSSARPDPELDARYAGRNVAAYLGTGTPSAVTYVWCGPHWVNTAQ